MQDLIHEAHQAVVCLDCETGSGTDALQDGVIVDRLQADRGLSHADEARTTLCCGNEFCAKFVFHFFTIRFFPYSSSEILRMDDFLRTSTLPLMSRVSKKELLKVMEERGILAAPLAVKIGRDKDYIRDFLTGRKQSLKLDDAQKIADVLKIPLSRLFAGHVDASEELGMEVVGKVAAGLFKDVTIENQDSDKPRIAVARDLRFPNARQYALEVEGDSMDELFKDGSTVICVNFADTGLEYREGMCVHVERFIMDGQFVENTLKELRREGKTKWVLYPRSSNPSHKPIELSGDETVDILVKGIVIGKWEPIFFS